MLPKLEESTERMRERKREGNEAERKRKLES